MINKKASSELTVSKIIAIILVLIVVVTIILWAFRVDILSWIKGLPGFQQNPDETKEVSSDTMKTLGYEQIGVAETVNGITTLKINRGGSYVTLPFYAEFNSGYEGKIYAPKKRWGLDWASWDAQIGVVQGEHFLIDWVAYENYKKENSENSGVLGFDNELALLDKSKVINNGEEFGLWRLKSTIVSSTSYSDNLRALNEVFFRLKDPSQTDLLLTLENSGENILIKNSRRQSIRLGSGPDNNVLGIIYPSGEVYINEAEKFNWVPLYTVDSRIKTTTEKDNTGFYLSNLMYKDNKFTLEGYSQEVILGEVGNENILGGETSSGGGAPSEDDAVDVNSIQVESNNFGTTAFYTDFGGNPSYALSFPERLVSKTGKIIYLDRARSVSADYLAIFIDLNPLANAKNPVIGRIYYDGSVYFFENDLREHFEVLDVIFSSNQVIRTGFAWIRLSEPLKKTNLRMDYQSLKQTLTQ